MPLSKFSQHELEKLKKEFNALITINEKYQFWQEKLKFPYYLSHTLDHAKMIDFFFQGKTSEEREALNNLIIEEVTLKKAFVIYNCEKMKVDLLSRLNNVISPLAVLEEELTKIISAIDSQKIKAKRSNTSNHEEYIRATFFMKGYKDFYLRGKEFDLSIHNPITPNLISLVNGFEIGMYRIYLENKIKNPTTKKFSEEHSETTLKEQILILYFLGILDQLETTNYKNQYHLISKLVNRSQTKVKYALTYFERNSEHNPMTIPNLERVIDLLEKTGYVSAADKAKARLNMEKEKRK